MRSKKKLIVSMLVVSFVLLSIVATVAIAFALTQQTIKTSISIGYQANQVSAKVSASVIYADGTEESMVTANGKATSITFRADDVEDPNGTNLVPSSAINLTSSENYVVLKYVFENTGSNDFAANFNYQDTETEDENIKMTFSSTESNFKSTKNYILVEGEQTKEYYVKLEIENVANNAEFSGDITWGLDSSILVATPENAQDILDSNINNKTIVFNGTFNETLEIRPSLATSNAYHGIEELYTTEDYYTRGIKVEDITTLAPIGAYHYTRDISNVIFAATENSTFTELFYAFSGHVVDDHTTSSLLLTDAYDAVRNSYSFGSYFSHLSIENIKFTGFNFSGMRGRIVVYNNNYVPKSDTYPSINGIRVEDCNFTTTQYSDEVLNTSSFVRAAISITGAGDKISNIEVENTVVSGHTYGVVTVNAKNVLVKGCDISKVSGNAVAIQNSDSASATPMYWSSGLINIVNNTFTNTNDRAIRFGMCLNITVKVSGNNFINAADDKDEILKTQGMLAWSLTFENNNNENGPIADITYNTDVQPLDNYVIKSN